MYVVCGDIKMKYILNTKKIDLLEKYGFVLENKFSVPIWTKDINDKVYLESSYPDYELLLTYKYDDYIIDELVEVNETINALLEQNVIIKIL